MAIELGDAAPKVLRVVATVNLTFTIPAILDNLARSISLNVSEYVDLNAVEVQELGDTLNSLLDAGHIVTEVIGFSTDAGDVGFTPTTPSDWLVVPTDVQEALDTLVTSAGPSYKNDFQLYVDSTEGVDDPASGGPTTPYATIPYALAQILANGPGAYVLNLAAGVYAGAPISWPGNVSVRGANGGVTQIQHTLSYTGQAAAEDTFSFDGCSINDPFVFDCSFSAQTIAILANGGYYVTRTDTAGGAHFVRVINSFIGGMQITGTVTMDNCLFISGDNHVNGGGQLLMTGCVVGVPIDMHGNAAMFATACTFPGTITGHTIGPDTPTFYTDASSAGQISSITNVTINYQDNASRVKYGAAIPSNWTTPPTDIGQALDAIAANLFSLNGGPIP